MSTDPAPNPPPPRSNAVHRVTGLVLAIVAFAGIALLARDQASYGFAFLLGAPFTSGMILGRWFATRAILQVLAGITAVISTLLTAVAMHLAGALCGVTLGIIVAVPLLLGVLVGNLILGRGPPGMPLGAACIVAVLVPIEPMVVPQAPDETVETVRVVPLSATEAFDRILFYEDVGLARPRLLRVALPRPLRSEGADPGPGAQRRCVYEKGYLVKEVTDYQPGVRYAFRVVEQKGVDDHAVALESGAFEFRAVEGGTEVRLVTTYRPLLSARVLWRPFEHAVVEKLHEHVLAGMLAEPRTASREGGSDPARFSSP